MNQDLKGVTRKSLREYVHDSIVNRMAAKDMTVAVLASWSGITVNRVANIVLEAHNPTVDEAFMLFTALGIPLDHLVEHAKGLPFLPPPKEYFCDKCRMTFPVGEKRYAVREFTQCSVPGCKQRFWHGYKRYPFCAVVGIDPKDLGGVAA